MTADSGIVFTALSYYMSSLPARAHPHLELKLECVDFCDIAYHMCDWETKLWAYFGLTATDVSDIKDMYSNKPELQRCGGDCLSLVLLSLIT